MKNNPNMYRVTYKKWTGSSHAGGWTELSSDVNELSDVERFNYIQSVTPIYIEIGEPIAQAEIDNAIEAKRKKDVEAKQNKALKAAEAQVEKLKAEQVTTA